MVQPHWGKGHCPTQPSSTERRGHGLSPTCHGGLGIWGVGVWQQRILAELIATVPTLPNFLTCGEPQDQDVIARGSVLTNREEVVEDVRVFWLFNFYK